MFFVPATASAAPYSIDYDNSHINFKGTHADEEFTGTFEDWTATINFNEDDLESSSVIVTFQTESAKTGNAMYDGTLPHGDWFDIKNHPEATFKSQSFSKADTGFHVTGILSIKDIEKKISFDFQLDDDNPTVMTASFPIHRLDFKIGAESDAAAAWVSEIIMIDLSITATKI
jgi:polyisoprenoid-binding protein YceI